MSKQTKIINYFIHNFYKLRNAKCKSLFEQFLFLNGDELAYIAGERTREYMIHHMNDEMKLKFYNFIKLDSEFDSIFKQIEQIKKNEQKENHEKLKLLEENRKLRAEISRIKEEEKLIISRKNKEEFKKYLDNIKSFQKENNKQFCLVIFTNGEYDDRVYYNKKLYFNNNSAIQYILQEVEKQLNECSESEDYDYYIHGEYSIEYIDCEDFDNFNSTSLYE